MSSNNKNSIKLVDIGLTEDDDEFYEFPSENWDINELDDEDMHLWADTWDDNTTNDPFFQQLRTILESLGTSSKDTTSGITKQNESNDFIPNLQEQQIDSPHKVDTTNDMQS